MAVAERVPAHVAGDGGRSVRELIDIANADPRRGIGREEILIRIPVNEQTLKTFAQQELSTLCLRQAGMFDCSRPVT